MEERQISKAVIKRLPRYYRYLGEILNNGVERISSGELSTKMQVTASQIRQDLNNFGGFGQQGYGYNVKFLYDEIGKILGVDKKHPMIIIGGGNFGHALANYDFEKGKIYGFIGQNGAGKTTFLRLVTGLAFPTSGTLSLWGNSGTEELQKQRKRIGSMIETPALFPSMTAYQNMEVQRIQRGIPDKSVIKRTLDMVGLQDTGKKSVRNFSLGMRQRLGIAIALLNTPELLILDEPINGLDPAGIVEIRNLLKILNKEYGMTILVSSHILEELYQTASEFILIDHGKIIEEISDYELNERCKRHIAIKTTDVQKTVLVLEENLHTDNFKLMPDGIIRLYDYLNDLETVASALAESHILVTGLSVSGDTLEDYFLSKIGGTKDVKSPKN